MKLSAARRIDGPNYLKTTLRVGGVLLVAAGVMFLPLQDYTFTKRDLSAFNSLADLGAFVPWGLSLVVFGIAAIGASCLIRGDLSD